MAKSLLLEAASRMTPMLIAMDNLKTLVPSIQRPRFRGEGQSAHDAPFPDGRTYQTDALCLTCRNVLAKSGIIFGSKIGIVSSLEVHKLPLCLDELKRSAIDLHCHFCTLVWWKLTKGHSPETLSQIRGSEVTLRIQQRGQEPLIALYCKGLPQPDGFANAYLKCWLSTKYFDPTHFKPKVYSSRDKVQTLSAAYMDRARYWLRECEAKHPDCKAQNPNFMPTRIVHVGTSDSLIPVHLEMSAGFRSLNQDRRYCSLSHRWIGVEMELKTTNMEALMEEIPIECLSKASRDAISVTRHLGLKYLWIDSLCIIQDLPEDWTREAITMADIYENSVCTIAAAGETTVSYKAAFEARNPLIHNYCRLTGSWKDGLYVEQVSSGLEGTNGSSLVQHKDLISRGWVYQERILSPKIIFFGDREVLWSCRYGRASEEEPDSKFAKTIFGPLVSAEQLNASRNAVRGFSTFEQLLQDAIINANDVDEFLHLRSIKWYQLISEYTVCELSHEEDRLVALAGLAQRIQSKTGWQYLAGLWRQSLFHDLRWYRTGEAKERSKSYIAPTWSWASVGGNVSWHWLSASHTEPEPHPLIDIISVETETHPLDTTSTGKVTNGSLVVHGCLKTVAVFVFPPDWSRYLALPPENALPLMISNYYIVGWLWLDVVFYELEKIIFMPLIGDIFRKHSFSSGWRTGVGLALIPKANYYERIGFFSLHASKARDLPQQWLIPGEKEIIVIK